MNTLIYVAKRLGLGFATIAIIVAVCALVVFAICGFVYSCIHPAWLWVWLVPVLFWFAWYFGGAYWEIYEE